MAGTTRKSLAGTAAAAAKRVIGRTRAAADGSTTIVTKRRFAPVAASGRGRP